MATEPKRKAHVKRIYKIDPETEEIDDSIWIDVLRIDRLNVAYRGLDSGKTEMATNFRFKWNDDPRDGFGDNQNENGNKTRKTKKLEIENPDDEDQTIDLWIVRKAKITTRGALQPGEDLGGTYQTVNWAFNNTPREGDEDVPDALPSKRKFRSVKVVNNDLNDLDMERDGPNRGIIDWKTYLEALQSGEIDDSQWLDVEFRLTLELNMGRMLDRCGPGRSQYILTNNVAIEELENSEGEKLFELSDPDADPPPLRLDPLQFIVNVSWKTEGFLAVGPLSSTKAHIQKSTDGIEWTDVPAPSATNPINFWAAYGDGVWIVTSVSNSSVGTIWRSKDLKTWSSVASISGAGGIMTVAWGKPKNAPLNADGSKPKKGVFVVVAQSGERRTSKDAGLTWESAQMNAEDTPVTFNQVSFAGGMFFIGVTGTQFFIGEGSPSGDPKGYFYSSLDGKSWSKSAPILDSFERFVDLSGVSGKVGAYYVLYREKKNDAGEFTFKKYLAVGKYEAAVDTTSGLAFRDTICFATSSDGKSWSDGPSFPNEYVGFANYRGCVGQDMFVIPANKWTPTIHGGGISGGDAWWSVAPEVGLGAPLTEFLGLGVYHQDHLLRFFMVDHRKVKAPSQM